MITAEWLERHISDYSGFQHRQFLFNFVHELSRTNIKSSTRTTTANLNSFTNDEDDDLSSSLDKCCQIFLNEFQWLSTLWPLYPAQESLFSHRRHILHAACIWYPERIEHFKERELNFYHRILSNSTTVMMMTKSEQNWQKELIQRYLLYLKRNLNWTFD